MQRAALVSTVSRPVFLSGFGKTGSDLVFAPGKKTKQVAVGNGTEGFRAVAVVAKAAGGENQRPGLTVFGFQAFKRGESYAVSAIEMVEGFKELGFALMVRVTAVRVFGLRRRIGAFTFVCPSVVVLLLFLFGLVSLLERRRPRLRFLFCFS